MSTVERAGSATCIGSFQKIVKLAGRAFYDDTEVVVLDALTNREWVRDDDLAQLLKLKPSKIREIIKSFEQDKLIALDHRRETARREVGRKAKMSEHSYYCLDFAQICDVLRYRLHKMVMCFKDDTDETVTYLCMACKNKYNSLDVLHLISTDDDDFHCERCLGNLVEENHNAGKRSRDECKDMLARMEAQLKPLVEQLNRVKDLPVPQLRSLQAWEEARGSNPTPSEGFVGEMKIEVTISGVDHTGGSVAAKNEDESNKPLPPWMNLDRKSRDVF